MAPIIGRPTRMAPMNWAIIVAAGSGRRMGGGVPKPYRRLGGRPILGRTLEAFHQSACFEEIILVVASGDMNTCRRQVIAPLGMEDHVRVVAGGSERQESVYAGLAACRGQDDDLVLIHDGVRPLVTVDLLQACLAAATDHGACILAVPSSDTLKQGLPDGRIIKTLPRNAVWQAQTPQAFRLDLIRTAHRKARQEGFRGTDDAQLVERLGTPVFIAPGSRSNIKITCPEDLVLAEAIWQLRRRH
jgi:2-C-methyl-D-erythritol 4-phosphate cytidylyltransferase